MEPTTQTVTPIDDRPATLQDLKSFQDAQSNMLEATFGKIVEDQEDHAQRIAKNLKAVESLEESVARLENNLDIDVSDPVPFYKDGGFYKRLGFTIGVSLVTAGATKLVGKLLTKEEIPDADADAEIQLGDLD